MIKSASMPGPISALTVLVLAATLLTVQATPWQPTIRGCAAEISSNGDVYKLVGTDTFSQFIQCDYLHDNGGGSSSEAYCFYDFHNYTLYHYPNTPIPVDSDPSCPTTCPLAGTYLIKTSLELPGQCVTMTSNANGAPVQIRDCDYRNGNPGQKWAFNGSIMFQGNKCIDVKDGANTNGVRLQTWTCVDGAANQQFLHHGISVVTLPTEFIGWYAHQGLCMDLTDGINVSGNPVQMWACNFQNPNQIWQLEPVI
ncbi:ricin B lectin domain-containing protein [Mycena galopus ATCC 62051]|nr:ricin B lectin domain-containing protein [Mycena galopus ATCC 62051]